MEKNDKPAGKLRTGKGSALQAQSGTAATSGATGATGVQVLESKTNESTDSSAPQLATAVSTSVPAGASSTDGQADQSNGGTSGSTAAEVLMFKNGEHLMSAISSADQQSGTVVLIGGSGLSSALLQGLQEAGYQVLGVPLQDLGPDSPLLQPRSAWDPLLQSLGFTMEVYASSERRAVEAAGTGQSSYVGFIDKSTVGLAVSSSQDGFWRAGRRWTKDETVVPLSAFTDEQLTQLRDEPALTIRVVDLDETEGA